MISGEASIIPLSMRESFASDEKHVLLVGDAAGHVKPSTGGGIVFGCAGAEMAADAICNHISKGTAIRRYQNLYNRKFMLDTMLHSAARGVYSHSWMDAVIRLMNAFGMPSFLGKYGDMDRPTRMLGRMLFGAA